MLTRVPRSRNRRRRRDGCLVWKALAVLSGLQCGVVTADSLTSGEKRCTSLDLPIERIAAPPTQYVEFCEEHPGQCDMSGNTVVGWTAAAREVVMQVNRSVNAQVRFIPDQEWQGREEYWSLPLRGGGDCEDFALEKRRRLVEFGLPRGAMTMAIVDHQTAWFPHAILLLETSAGTLALDNLQDDVRCWDAVPYNYESRERPDGMWIRFDQAYWKRK